MCYIWNKFIWPFVEDLFCYTANLYWSLEWWLMRYVYSFNEDMPSSWMFAKMLCLPLSISAWQYEDYLVIFGISCFVTMHDLNVSRHMLYRAFISSFSVSGRKSITSEEITMFNSWGYLVWEDRRICIFKTLFLCCPGNTLFHKPLKTPQKLFLALREEGACCFVHWKRIGWHPSQQHLSQTFWVHHLLLEPEHSWVFKQCGLVSLGKVN